MRFDPIYVLCLYAFNQNFVCECSEKKNIQNTLRRDHRLGAMQTFTSTNCSEKFMDSLFPNYYLYSEFSI